MIARRAPRKKTTRKYVRKTRRYRKRQAGPSRTVVRSKNGNPFTDIYYVKLRYCDDRNLTTTSGLLTSHYYSCNSLYDPDQTGVGHQPFGFDQLCTMYNRYRVFAVKYRWTVWNTDTSVPLYLAINASNKTTADTDYNTLIERGYCKSAVLEPGGSRGTRTLSGYISVAKVNGVRFTAIRNEQDYQAYYTASPARGCYLHFYAKPADGSSTVVLRGRLQLVFYCEMFDRAPIVGS